jgi:hypothetical protein
MVIMGDDHVSSTARVRRAILRLPAMLFPYLPNPARIIGFVLAIATTIAFGLSWYGNNAGAGPGLAVFVAIMLTAFTAVSASLPRVTYNWLNGNHWFPGSDPGPMFAAIASHVPLLAFAVVDLNLAVDHRKTYVGAAAVGLIGGLLWLLHEGVKAKKEYDAQRLES